MTFGEIVEMTKIKMRPFGLKRAIRSNGEVVVSLVMDEDYLAETQLTQIALQLLGKAKNRLNKFYNPVLYESPVEVKEMTMEEKIIDAGSFLAQVRLRRNRRAHERDLPPPPETFGAYEKKGEKWKLVSRGAGGSVAANREVIARLVRA